MLRHDCLECQQRAGFPLGRWTAKCLCRGRSPSNSHLAMPDFDRWRSQPPSLWVHGIPAPSKPRTSASRRPAPGDWRSGSEVRARRLGEINAAGQRRAAQINSSAPRWGTPAIDIPEPRAGFVVSRRGRCARRCARIQTGNDSPWRPALWPCSHWRRPSRACCRA